MTAAILQIAQWSAENQPYSLALWVVLAGLLYWAWAWAAHMWEARQLPHLGNGGTGVNRQLPEGDRLAWLNEWFRELQEGMGEARVCCGDWSRIMSPGTMTRNGPAAVLLDPPYSLTGAVYANDSSTVSGDVRAWCGANGGSPLLRIAICGHAGEGHEALEAQGWTVETWAKKGGYQGADDRERIWFSPHCLRPELETQMSLGF